MSSRKIDLPQGILDLLILRTLALEPQHGWAISERIQQISSDVTLVQQGSLSRPTPPRTPRLDSGQLGRHGKQPPCKYYELTRAGRKRLQVEEETWKKLAAAVSRIIKTA